MREEHDSLGPVQVPEQALWGAQTQRSLHFFKIGSETMPWPVIQALVRIKKAAAVANQKLAKLDDQRAELIVQVCQEILAGQWSDQFPLSVWQTGSGTQTNMNVNEVIANRANQLAGQPLGFYAPVHPNDHVNMSQSSNDVFPSAMHLATITVYQTQLKPALSLFLEQLKRNAKRFRKMVKPGRTHLMDAAPVTLGQEFSGYAAQIKMAQRALAQAEVGLRALALGGSAVGTGLNTHPRYAASITSQLSLELGWHVFSADNFFAALAGHEALVQFHAALKQLAVSLMKIANDIRLMGSGPRCGLGELQIPENEPGSSIMPGKVNPTQCEALTMIATQVMGNDVTVALAASQGQLELNVYKPVILLNVLQSLDLLADGMNSFSQHCLKGLKANPKRLDWLNENNLMLVTALNPIIGYEKAAKIAQAAHRSGISLRQAALDSGWISAKQYDDTIQLLKLANAE
ncbi:MAG: class II fumarate hydratase [Acidobacteria bacterium]|nr:class II fumarate hydratase [Acidobacteriota bacterium]MCB9397549.1 class II fumarate hydratase [Acidobacteriota bacterium]